MASRVTKGAARAARSGATDVIEVEGVKMVRRGDVFVPQGEADPDLFEPGGVEEMDLLEPALQGLMTELGASDEGSKVIVHKIETVNGVKKMVYLLERHPSDFLLSDIQESYGAGEYQVKIFGLQPGTNYKVIRANKRITLGPTLEQARGAKSGGPGLNGVTVHAGNGGAGEIARALAETMSPMITAMTTMMTRNSGGSRKEIIEEMTALAAVLRPAGGQSDGLGGLGKIAELKAMAELFKSFGGGAGAGDGGALDNESGPWAVLMRGLDAWQSMAANRAPGEPAPQPGPRRAIAAPAAAPAAAPIATDEEQPPTEDEMKAFMNMQVAFLLNAAKGGGDPGMYATLVYEQAPDQVLALLAAPNWFDELCKLAPEFSAYKPWCESVRALVLEDMKTDGSIPNETVTLTPDAKEDKSGANAAGATGNATTATTRPT